MGKNPGNFLFGLCQIRQRRRAPVAHHGRIGKDGELRLYITRAHATDFQAVRGELGGWVFNYGIHRWLKEWAHDECARSLPAISVVGSSGGEFLCACILDLPIYNARQTNVRTTPLRLPPFEWGTDIS